MTTKLTRYPSSLALVTALTDKPERYSSLLGVAVCISPKEVAAVVVLSNHASGSSHPT